MAKYRKKPIVINAIKFEDNNESLTKLSNFINNQPLVVDYSDKQEPKLKIETLEGTLEARVGDYIIKGIAGEFYPCKADIFEQTYEPYDDNNQ